MTTSRFFRINSDAATPQPERKRYVARQVVGTTLGGVPVVQGYEALEVSWTKMTRAAMVKLQSFYSALSPQVTITYTDPVTNTDVVRSGVMEPIQVGGVSYNSFDDVSVRFSHLVAV